MQSPWQQHDIYSSRGGGGGGDQHHGRIGSFGLYMERSTSAPPVASASPSGDSLLGNDLLEHMARGGETIVSTASTPVVSNPSSSASSSTQAFDNFSASLLDAIDNSGRATAPTSSSPYLHSQFQATSVTPSSSKAPPMRSLSISSIGSSGGTSLQDASDSQQQQQSHRHHKYQTDMFGEPHSHLNAVGNLGTVGLVRSQSAAPALYGAAGVSSAAAIGPPPGLTVMTGPSEAHSKHARGSVASVRSVQRPASTGVQRPASTGVLGNPMQNATLRPSAKTLMELITEDVPEDAAGAPAAEQADFFGGGQHPRSGMHTVKQTIDYVGNEAYQQPYHRQPEGALRHGGGGGMHTAVPSHHHQNSVVNGINHASSMQGLVLDPQQQATLMQMQQRQHQPQHVSAPGASLQQQQMFLQTQQQMQPQSHQFMMSGDAASRPPQLMQHQAQQGAQQQIFFGGQSHQQPPASHPAQVVSAGQTIYLNGPSPQTSFGLNRPSPQNSFGYTLQYHNPHQQPPLFHQSAVQGLSGRNEQQFVSVVPVHNAAGQLTYWQHDPASQQQGMSAVTILNPNVSGGGPVAVSRVSASADNHHSGNSYGRGREKGGGRGRRVMNTRRNGSDSKSSTSSTASALLDEFRSTKTRDWTTRQIEGHVVEFCQDQNGSRFIQQRLEMGDPIEQQIVMNEIMPQIRKLRNDVFGNYVVQKLLDFGTPQMKIEIRNTLEGDMLLLSLQMYGCRVVQKGLEALDESDLPRLLLEFQHNVLSCIHDQNGNHVIQKCIEVVNTKAKKATAAGDEARAQFLREQIDFIIDDVLVNTTALSCHPYGCRVLQRILEHCDEAKKTIVLDEIRKCHQKLLDDQYGNYVIQHVIQFGRQSDRDSILEIVVQNGLLRLSRQKFASNVVEKLLKYGNANQRRAIVREMLKIADDPPTTQAKPSEFGLGPDTVALLMVRDAYANYVVQTTLDVVPESDEKRMLLKELNAHSEELKNYTFAKHIVTKLASMSGGDNK